MQKLAFEALRPDAGLSELRLQRGIDGDFGAIVAPRPEGRSGAGRAGESGDDLPRRPAEKIEPARAGLDVARQCLERMMQPPARGAARGRKPALASSRI